MTLTAYPKRTNGSSLTYGARFSYLLYDLVTNILIGDNSWLPKGFSYYNSGSMAKDTTGTNQWDSYTKIRNVSDGTDYAWAVLENAEGVQVCIVLTWSYFASSSDSAVAIGISPVEGFDLTTTSTTDPPNAPDAIWDTTNGRTSTDGARWDNASSDDDPYLVWADANQFFVMGQDLSNSNKTNGFFGALKYEKYAIGDDYLYEAISYPYQALNDGLQYFKAANINNFNNYQLIKVNNTYKMVRAHWAIPIKINGTTIYNLAVKDGEGEDPEWEIQTFVDGSSSPSWPWARRGVISGIRHVAATGNSIAEGTLNSSSTRVTIGDFTLPWDPDFTWV